MPETPDARLEEKQFKSQFNKLLMPVAVRKAFAWAKIPELDAALADIDRRLALLEKSSAVVNIRAGARLAY